MTKKTNACKTVNKTLSRTIMFHKIHQSIQSVIHLYNLQFQCSGMRNPIRSIVQLVQLDYYSVQSFSINILRVNLPTKTEL